MDKTPYSPSLVNLPKEEVLEYLLYKRDELNLKSISVSIESNNETSFFISTGRNQTTATSTAPAQPKAIQGKIENITSFNHESKVFNSRITIKYEEKQKLFWQRSAEIEKSHSQEIVSLLHAKEAENQTRLFKFREQLVPLLHSTNSSRLQQSLELLIGELRCEIGTLWQYQNQIPSTDQPAMLTLRAAAGKHHLKNYTSCCLPRPHGLAWVPLETNESDIILVNNVTRDDLANKNTYEDYFGKTLALVKLHSNNEPLGTICLVGTDSSVIAKKINHIRIFQDFAAVTLKEMEADRRRQILDELPHLFPEGRFSVRDLSTLVVASVRPLVSAQGASIFLLRDLDKNSRYLELTAVSTSPSVRKSAETQEFEKGTFLPRYQRESNSLTASIARTERPIVFHRISDHKNNSRYFREIADDNFDSWIGVPLVNGSGSVVGVLRCLGKFAEFDGTKLPYVFSEFDLSILSYIADLFTKFLDTIEAFERYERLTERLAWAEKIRTHEIAAPLAAISANASFILQHLNDTGVKSKERRLTEIISDTDICVFLLRETRLPDQESFNKALQYGSVVQLIREVQSFLERQIASRGKLRLSRIQDDYEFNKSFDKFMRIRTVGTASNTMIHRWLLQRAFYNLGVNAIKYGNHGGTLNIYIRESRAGDFIIIDFSDDGIGVPEGDEEKIFNEGIRGSNISEYPGEGLGLSIAKSILEAHGGSLTLEGNSKPTVFRCRIPVRKIDAAQLQFEYHPAFSHIDPPLPRN